MPLPNTGTIRQYYELLPTLYFRYYQSNNYIKDKGGSTMESYRTRITNDYDNFIRSFSANNTAHTVTMNYGYLCPYPFYSVNPQIMHRENDDTSIKGYSSGSIYSLKKTDQLASSLSSSQMVYNSEFLQKLKDMFNNAKEYIPINSSLNNVNLEGLSIQETKTHVKNMLQLFNSIISNEYFIAKNTSTAPYEQNEPKIIIKELFNSIISSFTHALQIIESDIITLNTAKYANVQTNTDYINKQTRELYQVSGTNVDTYISQYSQTMALGAILTIIMSSLMYFLFSNIYSEGLGYSGNGSSNMPLSNGLPGT